MSQLKGQRRVVVTGLGLVSPVGNTVGDAWNNLLAGRSGIATITKFDHSNLPVHFAGEVKGFNIEDYIPAKEARHMDTFIHYGIAAGMQAFKDSGLTVTEENSERIGVLVGSGIGGLPLIEETHTEYTNRGARRISPFFVPGSIINMISGHLSINLNLKGPNLAAVTACTTGLHSLGLAARLIQYGDADVMIAGGAESTISPLGVGGFAAARALSTRNDDPATASRPWDKDRDGFVLGEGSGVMVLEEYEHAKARGAKIYAEVTGYGATSDGYDMVAPSGEGGERSMRLALSTLPKDRKIDYINSHGTSTVVGDVTEMEAVRRVFGKGSTPPVASTKSLTGHSLGATGVHEAIYSLLMMQGKFIAASANVTTLDPALDPSEIVTTLRENVELDSVLSNSFGFGGTNATLVMSKYLG